MDVGIIKERGDVVPVRPQPGDRVDRAGGTAYVEEDLQGSPLRFIHVVSGRLSEERAGLVLPGLTPSWLRMSVMRDVRTKGPMTRDPENLDGHDQRSAYNGRSSQIEEKCP